jgi:RNA polymerase sigma-70 factor, ECF subfamily
MSIPVLAPADPRLWSTKWARLTDYRTMSEAPKTETEEGLTELLRQMARGDREVDPRLTAVLYHELRRLARSHMRAESPQTLQTTALVHEAYLRLFRQPIAWNDRVHFFAVACQTMRRVLVDHARAKKASKRHGGVQVDLDNVNIIAPNRLDQVLEVDEALTRFSTSNPRQSQVVEMHIFGGLGLQEIAELLGLSVRTIKRDWEFAKAWLFDSIVNGGK